MNPAAPLFWRYDLFGGPDHVLSYLIILTTVIAAGIYYYKNHSRIVLALTDLVLIVWTGTWFSNYVTSYYHNGAGLILTSIGSGWILGLIPIPIILAVTIFIRSYLLPSSLSDLKHYAIFLGVAVLPYIYWVIGLHGIVDFVGTWLSPYYWNPLVSLWEIIVWAYLCFFYFIIMVKQ